MKTILTSSFILVVLCLIVFWPMGVYGASWEPSPSFIAYMKRVEGFRSTPYRCAGGYLTIGYGHNLSASGISYGHLTEGEATTLLVDDIKAAYRRVCSQTGWSPAGWQAEVAVDFTFNGCGHRQFPKFFGYLRRGDRDGMRREYKRYCKGRPLTGRNKAFLERYL